MRPETTPEGNARGSGWSLILGKSFGRGKRTASSLPLSMPELRVSTTTPEPGESKGTVFSGVVPSRVRLATFVPVAGLAEPLVAMSLDEASHLLTLTGDTDDPMVAHLSRLIRRGRRAQTRPKESDTAGTRDE